MFEYCCLFSEVPQHEPLMPVLYRGPGGAPVLGLQMIGMRAPGMLPPGPPPGLPPAMRMHRLPGGNNDE